MCGYIGSLLFILCLITVLHFGTVNGLSCCEAIPEAAVKCREVCNQLSVTNNQVEQISILASAPTHCPHDLIKFWDCAEKSLPVLLELGTFSGRPCCNLTKTKACREACIKAVSESDIENHCSRSTEDAKLYDCISRQRDGEKCCGKAITSMGMSTDSQMCKATCWNMYLTNTLTESDSKRQLRHQCTGRNKDVVQCFQKQTRPPRHSSHSDNLHCCENTNNSTCQTVCLEALKGDGKPEDKMDRLIGACGKADLMDPLYQCFLKNDNSEPQDIAGIDSAKLHCCEKASSKRCGSLCVKTHSWKWSSIHKFEQNCGGHLSSPVAQMESLMHGCLKDVEEPCQLGCNGLDFCTAMNHRPLEHFRSCTKESDNAARNDIMLWQKGTISLPSLSIPVKDIRNCEPEMWKAIACAYQIKPCYKKPTPPQICQEDCDYIMNKCGDSTRLNGQMVTDICKRLPLAGSGECISVKQYMSDSPHKTSLEEITTPCKPNPCGKDEVCLLHRRKCRHSKSCPHFVCRKACKMGQVSKVMVPQNTHVVIPVYHSGVITECQHYTVCHCSHTGHIGNCNTMPCLQKNHCTISTGNVKSHGDHFRSECNDCVCFGGETICTKRQCNIPHTGNILKMTGILNCECIRKYQPVCATNGKTYPNSCMARCAGQTQYLNGACYVHDPCKDNPCEKDYRCLPHKQICLANGNSPCIQYKCVDTSFCSEHNHEPVCDSRGLEYTNDCILLSKGKSLAYRGHCVMSPCSSFGLVCGHDGETYVSECTALAARTTIDYLGACRTFGYTSGDQSLKQTCEEVECKPVNPSGCKGIIPSWSCCPICAAELRVLINENLVADVRMARRKGPITLNDILETLSTLMSVSECDVFGYLGLDGDIIILVAPVKENPTALQVNACIKEAERFDSLIQSRSPTFASNMLLTPFLYAPLRTPVMTLTSGAVIYTQPYLVILTLILLHFMEGMLGIV